MNNYTIDRKMDDIYVIADRAIHDFIELRENPHGRITIQNIHMSREYDFLDITVSSEQEEMALPHFLAPLAPSLRREIGARISLRKLPKIRFRNVAKEESSTRVLSLLSEIAQKYDLS